MDFVSHILVGRALASSAKNRKCDILWITLFAFLPDVSQLPIYLYLGRLNNRLLWIPLNSDWVGFRVLHPAWAALWEITHSFLFMAVIIVPIVFALKLPKMTLCAYGSHIIIDLFTHTGEFSVKPFYPFDYTFEGFTDAWAWPFPFLILSWLVLVSLIILLKILYKHKAPKGVLTKTD